MTCAKQEFCIHEKYCQRHIGQNFDSCILFSRNSKPMTNKEYIRTSNVNNIARCIATKLCELARHEYGIYDVVDYATIFEWLKEKYDGGNT